MSQDEVLVECSVCGRNGTPPPSCNTCKGSAPVQSRAYTLSELRNMQGNEANRYEGGVGPKSSPLVVGGVQISLPTEEN